MSMRAISKSEGIFEKEKQWFHTQEIMSAVLDILPYPAFAIDREGGVIDWNYSIESLTGIKKENIIGKGNEAYAISFYGKKRPLLVNLVASDDEVVEEWYSHVKREDKSIVAETVVTLNGQKKRFFCHAYPLKDYESRVYGAVEIIKEIKGLPLELVTTKEKDEKSKQGILEESNARLNLEVSKYDYQAIEGSRLGKILVTLEGRFLRVNNAFSLMVGYSAEELQLLGVSDVTYKDDFDETLEIIQKLKDGKYHNDFATFEKRYIRKNKTIFWGYVNIFLARSSNGEPLYLVGEVEDNTERKKAADILKRSEKRYKAIVEDMPALVCRFQPDGIVTYVNHAYCKYFKKNYEAIVGKSFFQFIPENEHARVRDHFESLNTTKPVVTYEHRITLPDGEVRWQRWTDRALFDKRGLLFEYQSVGYDITDSKEAEKRICESETRFRSFFEYASIGMVIGNIDGSLTMVNKAICDFLGYTKEELLQKKIWEVVHSDEREIEKAYIYQMIDGRIDSIQQEKRYLHKEGHDIWALLNVSVVCDSEGTPLYFSAQLHDVTERKKREQALKESEDRYRILTENVSEGVILTRGGRILFANTAAAAMLNYSDSFQLQEKEIIALIRPNCRSNFLGMIDGIEKGAFSKQVFQFECLRQDGCEIWAEGCCSMIDFEGRPAILFTMRDISERKLREIAIEEETKRLEKENVQLKATFKERYRLGSIIGKSPAMQEVYELIHRAAETEANVIVYGESGTGKELVARAIHDMSERRTNEFVSVNCGAIPETLLESEFFGHKKGSFTGAHMDKHGFLDLADCGSLFLDEIGELNLNIQAKLLRAIEDGGYTPLGSTQIKRPDVRFIAATNRDLMEQVRRKHMRADFFYRIHVIPITLPPLRNRREDIPLLIEHFLKVSEDNQGVPKIPGKVMDALYNYDWPGNVRELQNVLHRYVTLKTLDFLNPIYEKTQSQICDDENFVFDEKDLSVALEAYEKNLILKSLKQNQWHRIKAASALGISRNTLFRKMKNYNLA